MERLSAKKKKKKPARQNIINKEQFYRTEMKRLLIYIIIQSQIYQQRKNSDCGFEKSSYKGKLPK